MARGFLLDTSRNHTVIRDCKVWQSGFSALLDSPAVAGLELLGPPNIPEVDAKAGDVFVQTSFH